MTRTLTMDRYAEALHDVFRTAFSEVLVSAAATDAAWKHRITTFNNLALLDFTVPSPYKVEPLNIDESRLDDVRYRRMVIRKLKAPRPSKWARHKLQIDRSQVEDAEYRDKIAKVLAYKWIQLLLPLESYEVVLPIVKLGGEDIGYLLDKLRLNDMSASHVSGLLMRRLAYSLIDENAKYQELVGRIQSVGREARERLSIEMAKIREEVMSSFNEEMARMTAESNRKADRAIASIKRRSARSSARAEQTMAECAIDPNEDREVTFRKTVLANEARLREERREARRNQPLWLKLLKRAGALISGYVVAFHVKVNGLTLVEWLEMAVAV